MDSQQTELDHQHQLVGLEKHHNEQLNQHGI
jgi:hypothetical protein